MVKKNSTREFNPTGRLVLCSVSFRVVVWAMILAAILETQNIKTITDSIASADFWPRFVLSVCYLASWGTAIFALREEKEGKKARILVYVYSLILLFELVLAGSLAGILRG